MVCMRSSFYAMHASLLKSMPTAGTPSARMRSTAARKAFGPSQRPLQRKTIFSPLTNLFATLLRVGVSRASGAFAFATCWG